MPAPSEREMRMKEYLLSGGLHEIKTPAPSGSDTDKIPQNAKRIYIFETGEFEEFERNKHPDVHMRTLNRYMASTNITKSELYGSCILGVVCMPLFDKSEEKSDSASHAKSLKFGYYIDENRLYLVGRERPLTKLADTLSENRFSEHTTTAGFFCVLLNFLLEDDLTFLNNTEKALGLLEDKLIKSVPDGFSGNLIPHRKNLMNLDFFYEQLSDLAENISSGSSVLLSKEDCMSYTRLSDRADRLHSRVTFLREYLMQIREMHQTLISEKQSKTMNLLAVISAIFLPLTLLVGWYGMNFTKMPELESDLGYPAVIIASVVIVVIEIIIFRKKHLL